MTRTANESSSGIYTPGDGKKQTDYNQEKREEKKEIYNQTFH